MSIWNILQADDKSRSNERWTQEDNNRIGLEDVQKELGALGRYQIQQLLCRCLCYIPYVFASLGFVFIGYEPEHECLAVNETELLQVYDLLNDSTPTISYGTCSITVTSNITGNVKNVTSLDCLSGNRYHGGKSVSMVTEWDLVCGNSGTIQLVQSMMYLGNAFGMVIWTSVADRFGRKVTYVFTLISGACMELGLLLSQSFTMAIIFRCFSGFFNGGMTIISFVMAQELFVSKYRPRFGACDILWWCFVVTAMSGCAFILRHNDWRHLQILTLATFAPPLLLSFFLNETPAWYFAKGRYEDAKKALMKACTVNKKKRRKLQMLYNQCVKNENRKRNRLLSQQRTDCEDATYSLLDFFRHKKLLIRITVLVLSWISGSFGYYGIFLTSSTLAGDRYLNFFLLSVVDIPASIIIGPLLICLGRRTALIMFYGMSAATLLISTCLVGLGQYDPDSFGLSTAFFLFSKFTITVSFGIVILYTSELYPTTMRSTALGVCEFFALTANIFAPFLLNLFKIVAWGPAAINTALCLVSAILLMLLPETKGRQLASTIEDVLGWRQKNLCVTNENRNVKSVRLTTRT